MKVSILIPTLNRLALLRESLESARRQTHEDVEILISDDGSADGTREFVSGVAATDARVRLLPPNPMPGLFSNINHLIQHSRGDACCILADDDRLLPRFVERLLAPLAEDPRVVISFCDHWIVAATGERLVAASDHNSQHYGRANLVAGRVADPLAIALRGTQCIGFSLYRASAFRHELFDLGCAGAADVDYAIRAARTGAFYYVAERLGDYRVHPGTATATRTAFMIDGAIRAYSKHSFEDASHEQLRLGRLRAKYRVKAVYMCTRDRHEWWESIRMYRRRGGSLFHPGILLSCGLAMLPHGAGEIVRALLKAVRAWGVAHAQRRAVTEGR